MASFVSIFPARKGLTPTQRVVYRNFNILLLVAIADVVVILIPLSRLEVRWPFWVCVVELIGFLVLLAVHLKGSMLFARYAAFVVALATQCTACLVHGETAGFHFVFYALAVLPALFFERSAQYVPLFLISIAVMLGISYVYSVSEPVVLVTDVFYYWNMFFTAALILLVMYVFKSGYERNHRLLTDQHELLAQQKEEIEGINNNLEQLIVDRTEKLKDHEARISQAAFINAHRVRSPLARILGLLNLIEFETDKRAACEEYLPLMKSNAEELNEMLREVSVTLSGINVYAPGTTPPSAES